jgi:predicted acylesterase/phospholipase RssA
MMEDVIVNSQRRADSLFAPPISRALRKAMMFLFMTIGSFVAVLSPGSAFAQSTTTPAPIVIRIGITEYQDVERIYQGYLRLFHDLAILAPKDQPVSFQVAVGSYQNVLDWWEKKEIDAAVLAATPTAMLLKSLHDKIRHPPTGKDAPARLEQLRDQLRKLEGSYVATVGWPLNFTKAPMLQKQLSEQQCIRLHRAQRGIQLAFHTVAVIADTKELKPVHTFKDLINFGKPIKFLYTRPYSSSGYILPKYFLKNFQEQSNNNAPVTDAFLSQQPRALDRLLKNPPEPGDRDKILVAFVHDGTVPDQQTSGSGLRMLEGMDLFDDNPIPHNVILVNYNVEEKSFSRNKQLLVDLVNRSRNLKRQLVPSSKGKDKHTDSQEQAVPLSLIAESNWTDNYKALETWLGDPEIELPVDLPYTATIDEIVDGLVGYEQSTNIPPRLAVVFSGGGAKCAYQAGALEAIEAKFEEKRRQCSNSAVGDQGKCKVLAGLDIDLVVGTSGGSINALFAAMKTTKDPAGQSEEKRARLTKLWTSLRLASLINPSDRLLFWISAWFALIQSFFLSIFAIVYKSPKWKWRRLFLALPLLFLAELWIVGIIQLRLTSQVYLILSVATMVTVVWTIGTLQKKSAGNQNGLATKNQKLLIVLMPGAIALILMLSLAIGQGAFTSYISKILAAVFAVQTFACLAIFGIMEILQWSRVKTQSWWDMAAWTMLVVSILEFISSIAWGFYGNLPAQYHWLEHIVLALRLPFRLAITIPVPIAVGLVMIALPWAVTRLQIPWKWDKSHFVAVGSLALIGIAFATITATILLEREASPTDSAALATAIADALPKYYPDIVGARRSGSTLDRLNQYSLDIVGNSKIGRDLVITASRLHSAKESGTTSELPDDLYFYYQASNIAPADQRNQFISFEDHNEGKLLETIIGSSTIYPVFPPQTLEINISDKDGQFKPTPIDIVDGGFIHNSPIDAALKWQATHIIVIEASPDPDEQVADNFHGNIANAFNYLFDQAQSRDQFSQGTAEVYVLKPTCNSLHTEAACPENSNWNMDLFDFSQAPLRKAIAQGWTDVYAEAAPELPVEVPGAGSKKPQITTVPLFIRQAGAPVFRNAGDYRPIPPVGTNWSKNR